jgi:SAM-dependent methyltransferase
VSRVEDTYTHGHAESVLRSHRRRTAENSAGYLLPHLRSGQRVLDVGCGPGTITIDLARRVAPGRVIGIDRADQALAAARSAAAEAGVDTVSFEIGDVYALDLPDGSVDVVHAHQVLQHLTDPAAALREMARVCRPGGVIAARDADYAAFTWWPEDPRLDAWLALYRACARDNNAEPDAGRRLLAWAHAAGLADTAASAGVWCYATPADRAWWGGMWADRIVQSALADQAVSSGRATVGDLQDISRAWHDWAAADDGWFLVPHGEILARNH